MKVSALLTRFLNQYFGGLSDGVEMEGAQMWCQTLIAYLKEKAFIEEMPSTMDGVVVENWKEEALRRSLWWKDIDPESVWKRPLDSSPVNIDALGSAPKGLEDQRGVGRRRVRTHEACAVCARFGWNGGSIGFHHLWEPSPGTSNESFVRKLGALEIQDYKKTCDMIAKLLSPERYAGR